jgi:hypothetical protein
MNFAKELVSLKLKYRHDDNATQALQCAYQLFYNHLLELQQLYNRKRANASNSEGGSNVC